MQYFLLGLIRLPQFSYNEISNFPDNFMSLKEIHNLHTLIFTPKQATFQMLLCLAQDTQFLSGGYFAFSGYPIKKKMDGTNGCSTLSLVRNNKTT